MALEEMFPCTETIKSPNTLFLLFHATVWRQVALSFLKGKCKQRLTIHVLGE